MLIYAIPINYIISAVTICISLGSLFISIYNAWALRERNAYLAIDNQYTNLLSKGLSNPRLRDPISTCRYDQFLKDESARDYYYQYNTYAYMMWNFLETIYDFASKNPKSKMTKIWTPVLCEENKLHYRWFLKNKKLFRSNFVNYVINTLNELQVYEGNIADFKRVYKYMQNEFPFEELKNKEQMIKLLVQRKYKLYVARFKERLDVDDDIIGYALGYSADNEILFLDYIQILDTYQNCGYGSQFMNKLMKYCLSNAKGLGVLFEIEPANDGIEGPRSRRKKFYTRLGARKIDCKYQLPCQDLKTVPMDLMFLPCEDVNFIPAKKIKKVLHEAISMIHSDYTHTHDVINSYIEDIKDLTISTEIGLVKGNTKDLDYIYQIFELDVPKNFHAKKNQFEYAMINKDYTLYLVRNHYGEIVGFTFIYQSKKKNDFLFMDYLAINRFSQGQGYGKQLIDRLQQLANDKVKYGILAEVPCVEESPDYYEAFVKKNDGHFIESEYYYPSENGKILTRLVLYLNKGVTFVPKEAIKEMLMDYLLEFHGNQVDSRNCRFFIRSLKDFQLKEEK